MIKCEYYYLDASDICSEIEKYYNHYDIIDLKIIPHVTDSFYLFIIYR